MMARIFTVIDAVRYDVLGKLGGVTTIKRLNAAARNTYTVEKLKPFSLSRKTARSGNTYATPR